MENNLDKLFKSKLEGQEPEFHPAAWDRMEGLLDDEGLIASQKSKPRRLGLIIVPILLFGIVLSIIGYVNLNPIKDGSEGSTLASSMELNDNSEHISDQSNNSSSQSLNVASNNDVQQKSTTQNISINQNKSEIIQPNDITAIAEKRNIKSFQNEEVTIDNKVLRNEVKSDSPRRSTFSLPVTTANNNQQLNEKPVDPKLNTKGSNEFINRSPTSSIDKENNSVNTGEVFFDKNETTTVSESRLTEIGFISMIQFPALVSNVSEEVNMPSIKIIPDQKITKVSLFEIGIQVSSRLYNGLGYAFGPFVSYNIGNGYTIGIGGQFDVQKYKSSPELSVFDKEYSFGSTLSERKFSMDQQRSIRIPITIGKSFRQFDLSGGLVFYKTMMSSGEIALISDGSVFVGQQIDNQLIKPQNISFQLETSIKLNRYFKLGLGVEYKPKTFTEDQATSNNQNTFYPTLGLQYTFFKI